MLELITYIVFFVLLSGLMALVDAAVLSVSIAEIHAMAAKKKPGAESLKKISKQMTRAVVIIVLFTNSINILGPVLVGSKAAELYNSAVLGIITAILTFATIIFSEIIPKSLGVHYAPRISRTAAPVILLFMRILFPLVFALEFLSGFFRKGKRKIGTETQIKSLVKLGRSAGFIEKDEHEIINRAFSMNDKTVKSVMTPLKKVVGVKGDSNIADAIPVVLKKEYSRCPVFGKDVNEVTGTILSWDLLCAVMEKKEKQKVSSLCHPPLIVDAKTKTDEMLVIFQKKHLHMAVVQQGGKTVGLVTLEDILEELVGEIVDERDKE